MSDKIYNKNAREKALLEEAYSSVYNEGQFWGRDDLVKKGKEEDIARGAVKLVGKTKDGNYTSATLPKGDPKIEELEKQGYKREPIEDNEDKDFRDEQRDQDPLRHSGDLKKLTYSVGSVGGQHSQIMHIDKTFDSLEDACNHAGVDVSECIAGEWDDMGDGTKEYGVDEDTVIIMHVDKAEDEEGELSDDWMKQDYESRQEEGGGDHAKGVKMALEALEMFKDELHVDGHPEDININELADAHDQLSRALHWLLDETDVEYITGGRATRVAETQLDYKPTYGEY